MGQYPRSNEEIMEEFNERLTTLNENLTALSLSIENNNRMMNELIGTLRRQRG